MQILGAKILRYQVPEKQGFIRMQWLLEELFAKPIPQPNPASVITIIGKFAKNRL